ncbi:MAG: hypothetical protein MI810_00765 [Flavobacteriales bacterium]|nr:hypothetical protein [Flavobacteriales bacterium]
MKKILSVFLLLFCSSYLQAQISMDMEVKSAFVINGPKYEFSDDFLTFDLQNGYAYGVGFDLRLKPTTALSFSYLFSQSDALVKQKFTSHNHAYTAGTLKDYLIELGIKKFFPLKKGISVAAFIGAFANPYKLETLDRELASTATTAATYTQIQSESYIRFTPVNTIAIGPKLGFYLQKSFPRIGRFSMGVSYGFELTKGVDRIIYLKMDEQITNLSTSVKTNTISEEKYITNTFPRNPFLIEFSFKMPGSMIFKEKEFSLPSSIE